MKQKRALCNNQLIIIRLKRSTSFLRSSLLILFDKFKMLFSLLFSEYLSITSVFLGRVPSSTLNNIDNIMLLILKFLMPLSLILALKLFIRNDGDLPFIHLFKTEPLSLWRVTIKGSDLYLLIVAALGTFLLSLVIEIFLRVTNKLQMSHLQARRTHHFTTQEVAVPNTQSGKSDVSNKTSKPVTTAMAEITNYDHIIEELKLKLDSLASGQRDKEQCHLLVHGGDPVNCDVEYSNTELSPVDEYTQHLPSTSGNKLPDENGKAVSHFNRFKGNKEHIYEELVAYTKVKTATSETESHSTEDSHFTSPSPSTILLTLNKTEDEEKVSCLLPINDVEVMDDVTYPIKVGCKKDCRQSKYKGVNRNSSCAAGNSTHHSEDVDMDGEISPKIPFGSSREHHQFDIYKSVCGRMNPSTDMIAYEVKDAAIGLDRKPCSDCKKQTGPNMNALTSSMNGFTLHVDHGNNNGQFARGDCNSPTIAENCSSITSNTKSVQYHDVLKKGIQIKQAVIIRGKDYISNFRDMAKAIIRSLSPSPNSSNQVTTSSISTDTCEESTSLMSTTSPELSLTQRKLQTQQLENSTISSLSRFVESSQLSKPLMMKQLNKGVTLVNPEVKESSFLYRLRYWFSNLFGSASSSSESSDRTDSEVGCLTKLGNDDDNVKQRRNVNNKRKEIVSETFTYVTMNSVLLDEPIQPSWCRESMVTKGSEIPHEIQCSIFKGMAENLPLLKSSLPSVSNENVWITTSSYTKKRCKSRNKNNNMTGDVLCYDGSSDRSSSQDDCRNVVIHEQESLDLGKSCSCTSIKNQTEEIFIDQKPPTKNENIGITHPSNLTHKKSYKFNPLCKTTDFLLILLDCCFIALSSYCMLHLCTEDFKTYWILGSLATAVEIIGLDLLKAVFCSFIHITTLH